MFTIIARFLRPTFMFDADPGGGGGDPAGLPTDPPAGDPPAGEPSAGEPPAPVDWNARVTDEWGGEDNIKNAIELQKALQTREGVQALFFESGRALGFGDAQIQALWQQQQAGGTSPAQESIEDLLSDPERVLTASEIKRVLAHEREQNHTQQTVEQHRTMVGNTIDTVATELKLDEDQRKLVLSLADKYLPNVTTASAADVRSAMTRGFDDLNKMLGSARKEYVDEKREQKNGVPSVPKGGASSGGEPVPEPKDLKEAMARVRKAMEVPAGT